MYSQRPFRRNDIVMHETARGWSIPARVVRRLDGAHVRIINTLGRVVDIEEAQLALTTADAVTLYDDHSSPGRRARPLLRRMPSLRRLKQAAAWYEPTVWARAKAKPVHAGDDYGDEITPDRLAAIQSIVDAGRPGDQVLTPIGQPGW